MSKPRVIIYGLASCGGCQLQILDLEDELLDIVNIIDIVNFKEAQSNNEAGPYDVAIIEGTVTCEREIEKIKQLREDSKIVVAIGTCATHGNFPALKNYYDRGDYEKNVYGRSKAPLGNLDEYSGIDKYIKVDHYIYGCPPTKDDILQFLKDVALERPLTKQNNPVCVECKAKGNKCVLDDGKICLGPITHSGCGAICPTYFHRCDGCRGPLEYSNLHAELELFRQNKISKERILKRLRLFVGTAKELQELKV